MAKHNKSDRNWKLDGEALETLAAEYRKSKTFPNPYHKGAYRFIIASLAKMGANKWHNLKDVFGTFKIVSGPEWFKNWANKKERNPDSAKEATADGLFLQNIVVCGQRTADYAFKLVQVGKVVLKSKGCVIDTDRKADGTMMVRLNTNSDSPIKPARKTAAKPKTVKGPRAPKTVKASQDRSQTTGAYADTVAGLIALGEKRKSAEALASRARLREPKAKSDQMLKLALSMRSK